jgi:protein-disulfide isomerase
MPKPEQAKSNPHSGEREGLSKRDQLRAKRRREQQMRRGFIIAGISILVIIVAVVIIQSSYHPSAPVAAISTAIPFTRPQANGLSEGNPNAPVKVEEYADFQCPGCKQFYTYDEVNFVATYVTTGKVYLTFVPDSFLDEQPGATGRESKNAAEAAYCAGDQNKFWEYHDILYTNQGANENSGAFSDQRLKAFAVTIGLDTTKFNTCYDNHTYRQQVLNDEAKTNQIGVASTPSFTVNGKLVVGTDLLTTVDAALKNPSGN